MDNQRLVQQLLVELDNPLPSGRVLVGVDGYIDRIQRPVQYQTTEGNTHFPTLTDFGQHVQSATNKSAQVELDTITIKPGGNAPIMSHALGCLGIRNTCLGTLGEEVPEGVFQGMHEYCELLTLGAPATSNALEFGDGKLILSDLSAFAELDWELVKHKIGPDRLHRVASECRVIALVGWCNPPHATEIWRGMMEEIIDPSTESPPTLFFDLADPSKKSDDQIMEVLALINQYASKTEVVLGLNENETIKLYQTLRRVQGEPEEVHSLPEVAAYVYAQLSIQTLLVHPIDRCLIVNHEGCTELQGKLVASPKVSTGGGDNFNAGYVFGLLAQLPISSCMLLAMATSGAYVQNGHSPDTGELKSFLGEMLD